MTDLRQEVELLSAEANDLLKRYCFGFKLIVVPSDWIAVATKRQVFFDSHRACEFRATTLGRHVDGWVNQVDKACRGISFAIVLRQQIKNEPVNPLAQTDQEGPARKET